jgi:hypothetical protein
MLIIKGDSDDIVAANVELTEPFRVTQREIEISQEAVVVGKEEEIDAYNQGVRFNIGHPKRGGLVVEIRFTEYGVWQATVRPVRQDVPIPWLVSIAAEEHTAVVSIACPVGTKVDLLRWPI